MNPADIKVGKYYNIQLMCILNAEPVIVFGTAAGDHIPLRQCDLECVTPIPSEPPTLVGPAPKHDPCREYRAGDKVELKTNFGRNPYDTFTGSEYIPDGTVFTVLRDEWADGKVDIYEKEEEDAFTVHFSNLALVTPVEELEPYIVIEMPDHYALYKEETELCIYWKNQHPHAKAAAEAERDRLNAEYRKEQK